MNNSTRRKPGSVASSRQAALAALALCVLFAAVQANAQQPGTGAVVSMSLSSSPMPVEGWSVKRGLLGRPVYTSADGKQIGTILDLVVISAEAPYVLIIGAAGAMNIGGHAVAVPLAEVVEQGGVLTLPNATRATLKAMPRFTYSNAGTQRGELIRATSAQLARANAQLPTSQRQASAETGAARAQLELDNAAFQADITTAEDTLADLEKAEVSRWVLLREDLHKAMARVLAASSHPAAKPAATAPIRP